MSALRPRTLARLIATLALAYALALQGLLGAMGGAAFAGEIRLANQLGVICTIHGPETADDVGQSPDPTPGRMACIEHCTAALTPPAVSGQAETLPVAVAWPRLIAIWPVTLNEPTSTGHGDGPPPPPRGPPAA